MNNMNFVVVFVSTCEAAERLTNAHRQILEKHCFGFHRRMAQLF